MLNEYSIVLRAFDTISFMTINVAKNPLSNQLARGTDAWLKVIESYNLCIQLLGRRLEKANISVSEHDVLMALLHNPGATQQQVAKACFVAKSGVSMLLAKFEVSGLVRRVPDESDARIKRAYLTAKGEKIALKSLSIQQEIVDLMAKMVSDGDLKTIATVMQSVSTRLRAAK
jgi:MarR family transcriptional regulator, organic hydroperoxide resistance regulator